MLRIASLMDMTMLRSLVGGVNDYNNDKSGAGATVRNCYGNASVYSTNYQAGGLTGTIMKGLVEKCYFTNIVKNTGDRAIGLAGYHDNSGAVEGDIIVRNNINLASSILSQNQYPAQTFRILTIMVIVHVLWRIIIQ